MKRVQPKKVATKRVPLNEPPPPDYVARKVIIHSFLYYVLDAPVISDGEYDRMCGYVAKHWDELESDRKWALGSPERIKDSGHHVKFSSFAVAAALNYHKYNTGEILANYGEKDWKQRKDGSRFVTCAAPKPKRIG